MIAGQVRKMIVLKADLKAFPYLSRVTKIALGAFNKSCRVQKLCYDCAICMTGIM